MKDKRNAIYAAGFLILGVLLLVLLVLNVAIGSSKMTLQQVFQILFTRQGDNSAIVWNIRLPRLLTAALLGGALAVSGFLLQTFFGNPIAGPFVLGISSSAKLLVALTMIGSLARGVAVGSLGMILAAFIGSMLSMGAILLVSSRLKSMSLLIVCGIMIGYICSAVTDLVVTFASDSNIVNLHNWSLGSFSGMKWSSVGTIAVTVLASLALTFLLSKPMGAYQLGENYAQNMGVNVKLFRIELILLSSILSACVTAFAGPISFVGIAVPHLVKMLMRTAKPIVVIPASSFPCRCSGKGNPELSACALEKCDERPRRPLHPLPESLQTPRRIRPATRTVKIV